MKIKTPKFVRKMISRHVSNSLSDELGFDIYISNSIRWR